MVNQRLNAEVTDARDHFETIFNTNPDGVVISRLDNGIIVDINEGITNLTGFTRNEVIGSSIFDNGFWKNPDDIHTIVNDFLKKGHLENVEIALQRKDGSGIAGMVSARMITLHDVPHILSVIRDVTDRRKAEEALRESEERYRAFFESSIDGIMITSPDGSIEAANAEACRMLGMTEEELITGGRNLVVDPADARLKAALEERERTGRWRGELDFRRKDGTIFPADDSTVIFTDSSGKKKTVMAIRDITERKLAEDALRESEERFRVLTQNLQSAVSLIDEHGAFSIVNASFLRMFGIPADADILNVNSQDWARWQVFDENGTQLDVDQHPVRKAALTGRVVKNQLVAMKSPSGPDLKWLLISAEPILDAYGGIHRIICTYYDITDRKQAEEDRTRLLAEVEERAAALEATISSMAIGLIVYDPSGKATRMNDAAKKVFQPEFFFNRTVEERSHVIHWERENGEPFPLEEIPVARALRGETTYNVVIAAPFPDHKLWISASAAPVITPGGRMLGAVASFVDITDKKEAEDALTAAHLRTTAILEGITDTFYSLDDQWRFVMVNPAAEKAPFGRPAAEMLGKGIWDLYPALVGTRIHQHYLDAAARHTLEHYEALSPLNGRWYEVFMQGRDNGVDVYMRDTTQRKMAEEALRESEERFRLALRNAPVSVAIQDTELVYRWAYNQTTRTTDEIIGKTDSDLFAPEDVAWLTPLKHRMLQTGEDVHIGNWLTSNGRRVYLDLYFEPLRNPPGEITGIGIAAINLTDLKLAEQALAESQKEKAFLANLLDHSEQPFAIGYPDGRLGILNGAFERLTGYSADELRRIDWAMVLTPAEWQEPEKKSLEELHRTGTPVRYEKEYIRKDGSRVPIELLVHLVKDSGGKPLHYYSFITDITERKRAKEELEKKNEDLNALNEELTSTEEELHQNIEELSRRELDLTRVLTEKEVLLSEIHHRVKNNLTAFISLLSLEGSTEETPAGKLLKQDLQNRARSMALVHETLYRTNLFDEVDMEIYLTNLIDQVANSFRTTRPVKTTVEAHGVMLDIPRATPAGLIINELVTNSFKYAFPESFDARTVRHAPPTISITLTKNDGDYVLSVKDNGVGLPPGFNLAKMQTLGLKLVNFLARHQMRAKVEVHSDKGTEFIFRFKE